MTIRRLTTTVAAAALAGLALTGCGTSVADTVTAAVPKAATTAPGPAPPEHTSLEQVYLDTLADEDIDLGTDAQAIEIGHRVCAVIDAGGNPMQVGQVIVATGRFDHYDAGYIVGAAVGSFCPEYIGLIPGADI